METIKVPIDKVKPNPYQPPGRIKIDDATAQKFAESIKEHGLIQIPVCRQVNGNYEMGDGWLRLAGYRWLRDHGSPEFAGIPVTVRELTDRQMADLVMESNTVRKDLNPIELAYLYKRYLDDFKITQSELARVHNVSQGEIGNTVRLLELPEDIKQQIISQEITETHGRYLLQLQNYPKELKKQAERVIKDNIPVTALDREIKQTLWQKTKPLFTEGYSENPEFDMSECDCCEHRILMSQPWGNGDKLPVCDQSDCWTKKNKDAFLQAREKEVKQLAEMDITKIYSDDERVSGYQKVDEDDERCKNCDKRAAKPGYDKKLMIICTDSSCRDKQYQKKNQERETERKQEAELERQKIDEVFDNLVPVDPGCMLCAIECLLAGLDGDLENILRILKLDCEPTIKQILTALKTRQNLDILKVLERLCFELFSGMTYDEQQAEYMLSRFKGAEVMDAEEEPGGEDTEEDDTEDSKEAVLPKL